MIYTTDESELRYWLMSADRGVFMGQVETDTVGHMCEVAGDPEVNYVMRLPLTSGGYGGGSVIG